MKLFIDCRMLGSGGIGTYLESVLPYIMENNKCFLMCAQNQTEKLSAYKDKAKIINCDVKTFSIKELLFFPKKICSLINSCDLYYTPYCNIPSGIKIPVFTTIHDIVFLDVPNLSSKAGILARKFFYQHAINHSKAVFTVSQFSADRINARLKNKKTPVIVTYNSVPEWFLQKTAQTDKTDSVNQTEKMPEKTSEKDNTIIFVGNIKKHKGLSTLLDAFSTCSQNGLKAKLLIIGNAENFRSGDDDVTAKLSSLQGDEISFTGKISDEELKNHYRRAKLLVQPSLYEGFGMPPMEALFSGTNVIISDIPVFKEIYDGFPVTFFKTQDSQDLANKIMEKFDSPAPEPEKIPKKYSFKKTAQIIINTFTNEA